MPSPFQILASSSAFRALMEDWDKEEGRVDREYRANLSQGVSVADAASKTIYLAGQLDGMARLRGCLDRRLRTERKAASKRSDS